MDSDLRGKRFSELKPEERQKVSQTSFHYISFFITSNESNFTSL